MRKFRFFLFFFLLLYLAFARVPYGREEGIEVINKAMCNFHDFLQGLFPIIVIVLIIFAAVIYAAGQMLGAEMRSRANVWAMSMLVGAIVGLVIALLGPWFMEQFGFTVNC